MTEHWSPTGPLTCTSLNITVIINHNGQTSVLTMAFNQNFTTEEIEAFLNGLPDVERVGRFAVYKREYIPSNRSPHLMEIIFIFVMQFGVLPSEIPILELDSKYVSINCIKTIDNSSFPLVASLKTSQNFTYGKGFNVGFSPRFTPYVSLNVTHEELQAKLQDTLSWKCNYTSLYPLNHIQILLNESYESERHGIDNSTAYCGRHSKRSPGTVRIDPDQLKNYRYVSLLPIPYKT